MNLTAMTGAESSKIVRNLRIDVHWIICLTKILEKQPLLAEFRKTKTDEK